MNAFQPIPDPAQGAVYAMAALIKADLTPGQRDSLIAELGGLPRSVALDLATRLQSASSQVGAVAETFSVHAALLDDPAIGTEVARARIAAAEAAHRMQLIHLADFMERESDAARPADMPPTAAGIQLPQWLGGTLR